MTRSASTATEQTGAPWRAALSREEVEELLRE